MTAAFTNQLMFNYSNHSRFPLIALLLSLAAHLCALSAIIDGDSFSFAVPPYANEFIETDLMQLPPQTESAPLSANKAAYKSALIVAPPHISAEHKQPGDEKSAEAVKLYEKPDAAKDIEPVPSQTSLPVLPQEDTAPAEKTYAQQDKLLPPIRNVGQFIKNNSEKLSYRISLYGVPLGSTELEAKNEKGELQIASRIESTGVLSLFYPVSTTTQTRMFSGRYIMTTMKQRQGDQVTDTGFTINLGERNVFWADRLNKRYTNNPIPNDEVLDIFSALYFLRNRELIVGETILLHLFDSNRYVTAPVRIVRREKVTIPGLGETNTLLVKPELSTECFFRRTGEILIWLTDDQFHVPVRMETEIALGRVTAELVRAENR